MCQLPGFKNHQSSLQKTSYIYDPKGVPVFEQCLAPRKFMNPHLGKWQYSAGSYMVPGWGLEGPNGVVDIFMAIMLPTTEVAIPLWHPSFICLIDS